MENSGDRAVITGTLVICATPIGNLGDAPPRLATSLSGAHVVYAEDTRRAAILLQALGVSTPVRSYFTGNEDVRAEEIETNLLAGRTVALITDAGTPAVSDPGLSAVRAARRVGAGVTVIPGPSAVTAALAVSGLPAERFVFEGFLPRKGSDRRARLEAVAAEERTIVLFSSPKRLRADLTDLAAALGPDRPAVVGRELTKRFEEIWWGTLAEAVDKWGQEARGEVTLVIGGGRREPALADLETAAAEVRARVTHGDTVADAVREVARLRGVSRRALYGVVHGGATTPP